MDGGLEISIISELFFRNLGDAANLIEKKQPIRINEEIIFLGLMDTTVV